MCGITGIYSFNNNGDKFISCIDSAVNSLKSRGPDSSGIFKTEKVALGHTRLAIIDTSEAASQPFKDASGRYTIIYNGEFYNFKECKKQLENKGVNFRSDSDTEVMLYMYIVYGTTFIEKVNGCFSLAIYDSKEDILLILRDRMGIKPLVYYRDDDKLIFGSEMKSLLAFNIPKIIDKVSLFSYLELNYIPNPYSIFQNIRKLEPGTGLIIKNNETHHFRYYQIPYIDTIKSNLNYESAKSQLVTLLDESVRKRLVSDVPLGTFLSGGIDSSIITGLAKKYLDNLSTFSIGFKDEPFFDETHYAQLLAKKLNTNHHVFYLSNNDLFEHFFDVLNYIDEPFADSSAIAVYILSKYTKQNVTVALSGDGADELFAGYNKHRAHFLANSGHYNKLIKSGSNLIKFLPQSRNGKAGNLFRQLNRYSSGLKLTDKERYWNWCIVNDEKFASSIYNEDFSIKEFERRKNLIINNINNKDFNSILLSDMQLVLPGDMLQKVDLMSMANGLEIRAPFLDHSVVDYVFSLPGKFKIDKYSQKKILKDSFRNFLPDEIYHRKKHGFEVPLLKWFRKELNSFINDDLLSENFINDQNIFNFTAINEIRKKLKSNISGDITPKLWGLIVFQYWWKRYYL